MKSYSRNPLELVRTQVIEVLMGAPGKVFSVDDIKEKIKDQNANSMVKRVLAGLSADRKVPVKFTTETGFGGYTYTGIPVVREDIVEVQLDAFEDNPANEEKDQYEDTNSPKSMLLSDVVREIAKSIISLNDGGNVSIDDELIISSVGLDRHVINQALSKMEDLGAIKIHKFNDFDERIIRPSESIHEFTSYSSDEMIESEKSTEVDFSDNLNEDDSTPSMVVLNDSNTRSKLVRLRQKKLSNKLSRAPSREEKQRIIRDAIDLAVFSLIKKQGPKSLTSFGRVLEGICNEIGFIGRALITQRVKDLADQKILVLKKSTGSKKKLYGLSKEAKEIQFDNQYVIVPKNTEYHDDDDSLEQSDETNVNATESLGNSIEDNDHQDNQKANSKSNREDIPDEEEREITTSSSTDSRLANDDNSGILEQKNNQLDNEPSNNNYLSLHLMALNGIEEGCLKADLIDMLHNMYDIHQQTKNQLISLQDKVHSFISSIEKQ